MYAFNSELKKQLQPLAKRDKRTLSNLLETVMANYAKREFMAKRQQLGLHARRKVSPRTLAGETLNVHV